jgi:hypothetical protein
MKIALYRDAGKINEEPRPLEEWAERCPDFVRVSEFAEVTFTQVSHGPTEADVRAIDDKIGKAQAILTALTAQKNEMLALTYEAAP